MKDKHFFGMLLGFFLLLFFYILFPVPYILERDYWASEKFNIIFIAGSFTFLIFSVINNGILIHILRKNSSILGPVKWFYIMMLCGDLLYPWCYLPMGVAFSWIHHNDLWLSIDFDVLVEWSRIFSSLLYSFLCLSINGFMLCCILQFYFLYKGSTELKARWRVLFFVIAIGISASIFAINEMYTEQRFCHSLISAFTAFLPFTITFIAILLTLWRRKYCQPYVTKKESNYALLYATLLSYFLFWIPMFTVSNVHTYHERIEFEHYSKLTYVTPMLLMVKSQCNVLTGILSDSTIRKELRRMLCCQPSEENNNDTCVYYTNSGGEILTVINGDHVVVNDEHWSDTKVLI